MSCASCDCTRAGGGIVGENRKGCAPLGHGFCIEEQCRELWLFPRPFPLNPRAPFPPILPNTKTHLSAL